MLIFRYLLNTYLVPTEQHLFDLLADVQGPDEGGAADHERAQHPREPPGGAARDGQLRRRPGMGFNAVAIEV